MNSLLLTDGYKTSHHSMYPPNTTLVYSNFTPRSNKYAPKGCDSIVVFGSQMSMKEIHEHFANNFFQTKLRESILNNCTPELAKDSIKLLKSQIIGEIKRELSLYLNCDYDTTHFEELWDLGYLSIHVKSLEEGTICPIRIPMFTIYNTKPEFYWVTNYLETIISDLLWKPITSATIANAYKKVLIKAAQETDENNLGFVDWQGHDFSMRGLDSIDATVSSGLGHLTSFLGTDSLPAIWGARKYYGETGFVAGSVPATEHSVMCAGSKEGELETFKRLLETYKDAPVLSVVSDTWDLWNVITVILPQLKEQILAGKTKLVIRPDSGDPVDIICGLNTKPNYTPFGNAPEVKGVIELLWDIFGGTVNEQGYKVLDPHIGAIYGDSINIDRAEEICARLKAKGFASTNVVLGIGSFTYQFNTIDTFGFAMKATYVEKTTQDAYEPMGNPQFTTTGYPIFKDPATDDGAKKSATGLLQVYREDGELKLKENCTWEEEAKGLLKTVYLDGIFYSQTTLTEIREKLKS